MQKASEKKNNKQEKLMFAYGNRGKLRQQQILFQRRVMKAFEGIGEDREDSNDLKQRGLPIYLMP